MWPIANRKQMRKSYKVPAGKSERKRSIPRFRRRGESITVKIWSKFLSLKTYNSEGLM
jgi:hypothetical protein